MILVQNLLKKTVRNLDQHFNSDKTTKVFTFNDTLEDSIKLIQVIKHNDRIERPSIDNLIYKKDDISTNIIDYER